MPTTPVRLRISLISSFGMLLELTSPESLDKSTLFRFLPKREPLDFPRDFRFGGALRIRTADLDNANVARCRLCQCIICTLSALERLAGLCYDVAKPKKE